MATAVSANDERHASSLIVAFKFYPQMTIKMIHKCPPNMVLMMIQNDPNNKFIKSLNNSEKELIPTLSTDGFNKLDMSLLYKLIRRFNLVPEPSKKWGNRPLATNINQGDDMERMRYNRNDLVHRPSGGLSEEERDKFFKESIEIACRVDNFIGESTSSFETGIRNVKIHRITQEEYRQSQEKCAQLQQQLKDISGINRVDLYYGDDIAVKLGHQDLPATDSTRCTIYIRDPNMDVTTVVEQLEQAKKRINEGAYGVILLDAKSGSLVLHVEIHNRCFITKDSLHKAIAEFLRRVFTSISGSLDQHIMEVVLAECDSYIISDNEEKNDEYLNDQESSVLKLDVLVRNTSLQSETDLYRDVHGFISKVLDVTNKDVESTNGSPLAVTMTSQHVDDSSPSGTPEKKKLVGDEIDPDQLKLIKEDEGNKILWNEAKEFTKEGAQADDLAIKKEEQESAMTQNRSSQATNNFRQGNNPQNSDYSSTPGTPVSTRVHTIASLTHKKNRWRIRARVTYKTDITEWSRHHSKGTCFSVHLSDDSGEIRAVAFNDDVDKYFEMLEVDKIYFISKGTLKTANKNFNNLNKYEITLKADTTVELCNEDVDDSKTPGNTVERAASTALLDDNAPPSKIRRMTQEDQRFGISTSSPLQGTSHEKNPEEASVSKVESEKRPQKKKIKKVNKDEKMLILTSYISLKIKSDWDKLTDNVYKKRKLALSEEMTKHYQDLYKQNKLKNRIKGYIQRVQSGRAKEKDPEIIALI